VVAEFARIIDALQTDAAVAAKALSPKELIRTPVARRRLAIGASPGLFSCIAGNIIASYYISTFLTGAGITDSQDQLKAVRHLLAPLSLPPLTRIECGSKCLVFGLLSRRYSVGCPMGQKVDSVDCAIHFDSLPDDDRWINKEIFR
jgi:hypothetical protein